MDHTAFERQINACNAVNEARAMARRNTKTGQHLARAFNYLYEAQNRLERGERREALVLAESAQNAIGRAIEATNRGDLINACALAREYTRAYKVALMR